MNFGKIKIDDYSYTLPDERIAKYPVSERDRSKLLTFINGNIGEDVFVNITEYLPSDSLIVFNNTRVIPARLLFQKATGAKIEIFCLEPCNPVDFTSSFESKGVCEWKCLVGNLKKWNGNELPLCSCDTECKTGLTAQIIEKCDTFIIVQFKWNSIYTFAEVLEKEGKIPVPPYLNRDSEDIDRKSYQTIFGCVDGSVAAPTAGLHFTDKVMNRLSAKQIAVDFVTLHVGAGTFKPVTANSVEEHAMHGEFFSVSLKTIETLLSYAGNITAVGTTTVRTLESLYFAGCQIAEKKYLGTNNFIIDQWEPYSNNSKLTIKEALQLIVDYMQKNKLDNINASTAIMILPGFEHRLTTRLVTNFHQPCSTLLLLLASFVGDNWKKIYRYALDNNFRFLSYGDCCLIDT